MDAGFESVLLLLLLGCLVTGVHPSCQPGQGRCTYTARRKTRCGFLNWDRCTRYYTGYRCCETLGDTALTTSDPAPVNVALSSNGATCTSILDVCARAIDGVSSVGSNLYRWNFYARDPTGASLRITFSQQYTLYTARFMQLYWKDESNFKDLRLTFSDGSSQMVTLSSPIDGNVWDTFYLTPVSTTFVEIQVLSVYPLQSNNPYSGFQEVEFYDGIVSTPATQKTTSHILTTQQPTKLPETTQKPSETTSTTQQIFISSKEEQPSTRANSQTSAMVTSIEGFVDNPDEDTSAGSSSTVIVAALSAVIAVLVVVVIVVFILWRRRRSTERNNSDHTSKKDQSETVSSTMKNDVAQYEDISQYEEIKDIQAPDRQGDCEYENTDNTQNMVPVSDDNPRYMNGQQTTGGSIGEYMRYQNSRGVTSGNKLSSEPNTGSSNLYMGLSPRPEDHAGSTYQAIKLTG